MSRVVQTVGDGEGELRLGMLAEIWGLRKKVFTARSIFEDWVPSRAFRWVARMHSEAVGRPLFLHRQEGYNCYCSRTTSCHQCAAYGCRVGRSVYAELGTWLATVLARGLHIADASSTRGNKIWECRRRGMSFLCPPVHDAVLQCNVFTVDVDAVAGKGTPLLKCSGAPFSTDHGWLLRLNRTGPKRDLVFVGHRGTEEQRYR